MGSIKDKSLNDIEANVKRVARKTTEDVKETVGDVADTVQENVLRVKNTHITNNQKLLVVGSLGVLATIFVQNLIRRFREPEVIVNEIYLVKDGDSDNESFDKGSVL